MPNDHCVAYYYILCSMSKFDCSHTFCVQGQSLIVHTHFVFIGMIAHGHEIVHYELDFYPSDANHTVGSFTKLLHNLKKH